MIHCLTARLNTAIEEIFFFSIESVKRSIISSCIAFRLEIALILLNRLGQRNALNGFMFFE